MALAPGETFEHYHSDESVTVLLRGSVELVVSDERRMMRPGEVVTVAADVRHALTNVGTVTAVAKCVH